MLPVLVAVLALALARAAVLPTCAPLVPAELDNETLTGLLGKWIYLMGSSKYPPHLEELRAVKHATFFFHPGSHPDELNVTEIMRVNETCVTRNSSTIQVFRQNHTLMHVDGQVTAMAHLIKSSKDLLILRHVNNGYPGLSLSARSPNVSKEQLEEFRAQLACHQFADDEIFLSSEKDACPEPGEQPGEEEATQAPQTA
ncbi:alpha-1-acid glycoprotein 1-like [Nothoprocta perdicaria]|uniref:Alpha-1-acid glycoprotein 1-like n=1 Tax=Nothoprocta perdicaria TaxID=30464 RepID=A0A8C6YTW1_NOTPE|nr:alpha-1-acid glycoprotein 1-like [Nothoprocta perdicaria]